MDVSHKIVLAFTGMYYVGGAIFLMSPAIGLNSLGVEGAPAAVLGLTAVFVGAYVGSNLLFGHRRREESDRFPMTAAYTSSVIALSGVALLTALWIGLGDLMISRDNTRVPGRLLSLVNLHLAGAFLAAVVWGSRRHRLGLIGRGVVVVAFAVSFVIGVAEGRRTAVALPVVFLFITWWLGPGRKASGIIWMALVAAFGFGGIVMTTLSRVDIPVEAVIAALGMRLFNPAVMLSAVIETSFAFDTETLSQIVRRLGSSTIGTDYWPKGNEFGVAMGILSPTNTVVGINYGIICEAYLWGGVAGVALWGVVLERMVDVAARLGRGPILYGGVIVGLLAAHGMQMEIPYTIVAVLKGGVLVFAAKWVILLMSSFWRTLKVRAPDPTPAGAD